MELLPCPFCGSKNIKLHQQHWHMNRKSQCCDCHSESTYDEKEGITTWNTRHSPWISVKDRLPNGDKKILVYCNGIGEIIVFYNLIDKVFMDELNIYIAVTHWMPLPQPPKEK